MDGSTDRDEERIAALLRLLPPPPRGWEEAAMELPAARAELEGLVARAARDASYRARVLADLEDALRREGIEPSPRMVDLLRLRLEP
jgi:hypothetical protein